MSLYVHTPHPRREDRKAQGPVRVEDHRTISGGMVGRVNSRIGLLITLSVGTMWAAYVFTAIALVSLPSAIASGNLTVIVAWISSNFLQLILLPIVIVGQNIQARAADARAEATYKDAEAILHSADQIAEHLTVQDRHLLEQDDKLAGLIDQVSALALRLSGQLPGPGSQP